MEIEKTTFFEKGGWSYSGITLKMWTGDKIWPEIEKRSEEIQTQEREKKIEELTHAAEIRGIILQNEELPTYLTDNLRTYKVRLPRLQDLG